MSSIIDQSLRKLLVDGKFRTEADALYEAERAFVRAWPSAGVLRGKATLERSAVLRFFEEHGLADGEGEASGLLQALESGAHFFKLERLEDGRGNVAYRPLPYEPDCE